MRGTLHFVAAKDVRWMLTFLAPRVIASSKRRCEQLELDQGTFSRSRKLLEKALQGGAQLTRDDIYVLLEKNKISTAGQRGYHILWRNAQEGLICFGPLRGKQQTFVLLDDWISETESLKPSHAAAELATRYFSSHGPATLQDFVWWSGLKVTDARAGIEAIAPQFHQETVDGKIYWMPSKLEMVQELPPHIYLLPGFDEYLLGYSDRSTVLDKQHAQKICPGNNGVFSPTVISDGQVIGTWKCAIKGKKMNIMPQAFQTFGNAERTAILLAAENYQRFMGLTLSIEWQTH